jgi:hypothetical protein
MQDQLDKPDLADDLLRGGKAICREIYGSDTRENLRKLYNEQDRWPIFQLDDSGTFYALRSRIRAHLQAKSAEKESRIAAAAAEGAAKAAAKAAKRAAKAKPHHRRGRPKPRARRTARETAATAAE